VLTQRAVRAGKMGIRAAAGHESGLRTSRRTARNLRSLRSDTTIDVGDSARHRAAQLQKYGFLPMLPGYPADLIDSLQASMVLADDPATSIGMGGLIKDSVRYVVDPLALIPRVKELLTPELAETLRAWYGTEFRIASIRAWRIAHIPEAERAQHHYGNLWHVDGHELDAMKLFIQVSPNATREGSAFRLLPAPDTHRAFCLGFVDPLHAVGPARRILETKPVYFDGPPGDAAFVDTNRCLHRAGIPDEGQTRGMIQFFFKPSATAPIDGDYFANVPLDKNVYEGAIA
jgi:hypothetical protein